MKTFAVTFPKMHKVSKNKIPALTQGLLKGKIHCVSIMEKDRHYSQWYDNKNNHIYTEVAKFCEHRGYLGSRYYLTDYGLSLQEKVA